MNHIIQINHKVGGGALEKIDLQNCRLVSLIFSLEGIPEPPLDRAMLRHTTLTDIENKLLLHLELILSIVDLSYSPLLFAAIANI